MLNHKYLTLDPERLVSCDYDVYFFQHHARSKSMKGASLSGSGHQIHLTLCKTQKTSRHRVWGGACISGISNILQYARGQERIASMYIGSDTSIKFTFIHIPSGCNSCVKNELLHVVQARGSAR